MATELQNTAQADFVHPSIRIIEETPRLELAPTLDKVLSHMAYVNSSTAALTWGLIQERYGSGLNDQTQIQREEFGVRLDKEATHAFESLLHSADFKAVVKASEGAKEKRKYGYTLPIPKGPYGHGANIPFNDRWGLNIDLVDSLGRLELITDSIEGTTNASFGRKGSIAISGGSLEGGLSEVPGEDGDALYTDRVVAGARLKDKIHFGMSTEQILNATREAYGVSDYRDVQVVVLNRPRNKGLIEELNALGADVKLIESGDLTPALAALKDEGALLSMGSGGKEEAYIAAIAAKAMGGVFEGIYVNKKGEPSKDNPQLLDLDYLAPGDPNGYFVSLSSITGDNFLNLDPVAYYQNGELRYKVPTLTITSTGYKYEFRLIDVPTSSGVWSNQYGQHTSAPRLN